LNNELDNIQNKNSLDMSKQYYRLLPQKNLHLLLRLNRRKIKMLLRL
jgi:hypothetical protein